MNIGKIILTWYSLNKRELPWRDTKDPYSIWISEIIMQQTRINQGLPYYYKFIDKYPTVFEFAAASEDEILLLWQGLGYYSRARNMHATAKEIVKNHNGNFPKSSKELNKLKGIGKYTAAAIASFCFNEPIPAIDGNVLRLFSRLFDINKPVNKTEGMLEIEKLSSLQLPLNKANDYNQAVMDLGATICTPKNPRCSECPLKTYCLSLKNDTINIRPVKLGKQTIKKRYFNYLFIHDGGDTIIKKRSNKDIWMNLYEFPLIETTSIVNTENIVTNPFFNELLNGDFIIENIKEFSVHKLSHQHIHSRFYQIKTAKITSNKGYKKIGLNQLDKYAFPQLVANYLNSVSILD